MYTSPARISSGIIGSLAAALVLARPQRYLNTHGCPLANSGPGAYQAETTYFGPRTKAALACFQKDTGLIPPTGNFGPLSRQYVSTLP